MAGEKGPGRRDAGCGHGFRPSLAPFAAATSYLLRAAGHSDRSTLSAPTSPGEPSKAQGAGGEGAPDPAPRAGARQALGEGIRLQSQGHPGGPLPAGRRSSAPVVARSSRSRSRSAPPGSGFPRARPERGSARRVRFLLSAGDRSVQTFAPHPPHLPAPGPGSAVSAAPRGHCARGCPEGSPPPRASPPSEAEGRRGRSPARRAPWATLRPSTALPRPPGSPNPSGPHAARARG